MDDATERIIRAQRRAVRGALERIGEDLLGKAQRDAPLREGTLRASGELDIEEDPEGVWAEVSFNTIYAAAQHEGLDFAHPKGGRAKYLEANLQADQARYERIVGLAVKAVTR